MRALVALVLVSAPFIFAAPPWAAIPPGGPNARSVASLDGAGAIVVVGHLEQPFKRPAIAGGDADAAVRLVRMDALERPAAVRNVTGPTGSSRFAASTDDDQAVLVAQDVPAELLLAAVLVLGVGVALAATIGWRLWRP